jgi:hypothetical protein
MQQNERLPLSAFYVVETNSSDLDKVPRRRIVLFRLSGPPVNDKRRPRKQSANLQAGLDIFFLPAWLPDFNIRVHNIS